jgi:hypothetical protein
VFFFIVHPLPSNIWTSSAYGGSLDSRIIILCT